MGKQKTTQTQANKYEYIPQPKNESFEAAKVSNENLDLTSPLIQQYGQLTNQINESGNEFFGANTSPELRDKVRANRLFAATMSKGRDLSNAKQTENNIKTGNYMSLGAATVPQLVQTGGTSTTVQPFNWGGLISSGVAGGAQIGAAAM